MLKWREMNILLEIYIFIQAALLYLAMYAVCSTLRFNRGWPAKITAARKGKNVLFAVWHQETFAMFYLYRRRKAAILVTAETRGRILGLCARWLGFQVVAVPDQKNNLEYARSLAGLVKLLKQGYDAVIAVDGPDGPPFETKPGAYYLAGKAAVPVLPIRIVAPHHLTLAWRWDKYFIPLPFSPATVQVGQPVQPTEHATVDLKKRLEQTR